MRPGDTELPIAWSIALPDQQRTEQLATRLAALMHADDFVTLSGDLGAGKTTLARALIRHLVGDPELEVPSPTFTLLQVYDAQPFPIVHADLYRIGGADELAELGWDEASAGALLLVEWPDRIEGQLPADRLDIALALDPAAGADARSVTLTGHGSFRTRLRQAKAIEQLLETTAMTSTTRSFLTGDASTRAYERLTTPDGRTSILMVSPPRADLPSALFGRPYHHVARLAGDIGPFLAMDDALAGAGVSVPRILAADRPNGLALIEDLGAEPVVDTKGPIADRYLEAVTLLAQLHDQPMPATVGEGDGRYAIPPYDLDAYMVEVDLLIEWYAPQIAGAALPGSARTLFLSICRKLFTAVIDGPKSWCLRDFHSPNLLWLAGRQGTARLGVLDFQDCVIGHPAYDVVSLLQDARITVPDPLELRLLGAYAQQRRSVNVFFDMTSFAESYAVLGAQRATKILGAFARLDKRDGKPQYLAHIPRIEAYLAKDLAHPALAELRAWYRTYLPRVFDAVLPA